MTQKIFQVDSFTNKPFSGNPAGVCILHHRQDEAWMKNVACEMNLSETAFLVPQADGYDLRWFTPTVEVALCGHATLASAHILWEEGYLRSYEQARFHTLSGLLTANQKGELIELDFPIKPESAVESYPELERALGVEAVYVGKNEFDYIVEVESEGIVRSVSPNFSELKKIEVRGVIVTSQYFAKGFDFISRYFAPGSGIDEDPVTGSAHTCLGPYWQKKMGKSSFLAYQASERGGIVKVEVVGDRVKLGGQAVTTLRCDLIV